MGTRRTYCFYSDRLSKEYGYHTGFLESEFIEGDYIVYFLDDEPIDEFKGKILLKEVEDKNPVRNIYGSCGRKDKQRIKDDD